MGQKVHPIGFRLGVTQTWNAQWYADKDYTTLLHEDLQLREFIRSRLREAGVPRIEIDRSGSNVVVTIYTAKPGIVIGKKGEDIEKLRSEVARRMRLPMQDVRINISEIRKPESDAQLVAEGIVINGLPVMMNRNSFGRPPDTTLDKYYEENVIGGPGSFMIVASTFEDFGRAVRSKLIREISARPASAAIVPA